jgi:hypothetical protein
MHSCNCNQSQRMHIPIWNRSFASDAPGQGLLAGGEILHGSYTFSDENPADLFHILETYVLVEIQLFILITSRPYLEKSTE